MKRLIRALIIAILFLQSTLTICIGIDLNTNINNSTDDIAVIIKENEIWAIDINNSENKKIKLNDNEKFESPVISPKKDYVAYKDENFNLYLSHIDFNSNKAIKVSKNVKSYAWNREGNLIYSKSTGGMYIFNVDEQKSETIIYPRDEYYENIMLNKKGILFAQKYSKFNREDYVYIKPLGIIQYDLNSDDEKTVVPYETQKQLGDTSGLNPKIAGISQDGTKVFIWDGPNSASITADGVPLGYYNIQTEKFEKINNSDVITLTYYDNITTNPKSNILLALINGAGRDMSKNKNLIILDIATSTFKQLTVNGRVAMTPTYSQDGIKIIYSEGTQQDDGELLFLNSNNQIYEINVVNNEIKQLTKSKDGFNFYPKYIDNEKSIVFVKLQDGNKLSLFKRNNDGSEILIEDGILFDEEYLYYGHYSIEKVLDIK